MKLSVAPLKVLIFCGWADENAQIHSKMISLTGNNLDLDVEWEKVMKMPPFGSVEHLIIHDVFAITQNGVQYPNIDVSNYEHIDWRPKLKKKERPKTKK